MVPAVIKSTMPPICAADIGVVSIVLPSLFNRPKNSLMTQFADNLPLPTKTEWSTLHISLGKKDKVNKIDIVGFFSQRAKLKSDDIGLIEVKDFTSFVAVRENKLKSLLANIKDEKMKGKKYKIEVASTKIVVKEKEERRMTKK